MESDEGKRAMVLMIAAGGRKKQRRKRELREEETMKEVRQRAKRNRVELWEERVEL